MRDGLSARGSFHLWGHLGGFPRRRLWLAFLVLVAFSQHSSSNETLLKEPEEGVEWSSRPNGLVSAHTPAEASSSFSFFRHIFDPFSIALSVLGFHNKADGHELLQPNRRPQPSASGTGSNSRRIEGLQGFPVSASKETSGTRSEESEDGETEQSNASFAPRLLQDAPVLRRPRSAASASQIAPSNGEDARTETGENTATRTTTKRTTSTKQASTTTATTKSTIPLPPLQGWKEVEEGPLDAMKNEPDLTLLSQAMESNPLTQGDSIITRLAITLFAPTDEALAKLDVKLEDLAKMVSNPKRHICLSDKTQTSA